MTSNAADGPSRAAPALRTLVATTPWGCRPPRRLVRQQREQSGGGEVLAVSLTIACVCV